MIETLISPSKTFECVRSRIVEILASETASQQDIAVSLAEDPHPWAFRVVQERTRPWSEWLDEEEIDDTPIVNVRLESVDFDGFRGEVVRRQSGSAVYHVDCYGCGLVEDLEPIPIDEKAALEAQRAAGLVQSILMASEYTYLAFDRGVGQKVGKRWIASIQAFQPEEEDERVVHGTWAIRIVLHVIIEETSPQTQGVPLEGYDVQIIRGENGQLYAEMSLGEESL